MPPLRRIGRPSLVGTAARTAVVVGTATAVSGIMQKKSAASANANAEAAQNQAELDAIHAQQAAEAQQAQVDAQVQAALAAQAAQQQAAAPAAASAPVDVTAELQKLADLKAQGLINDDEFAAMKAKVLGI